MGLLAWTIYAVIELRKIMFSPINWWYKYSKKKKKSYTDIPDVRITSS